MSVCCLSKYLISVWCTTRFDGRICTERKTKEELCLPITKESVRAEAETRES